MTKKRKRKTTIPKHERLCSYWAGCNPFTGLEGNCDCGLSEIEPEIYVVLPESVKSVSVRKDRSKPKEEAKENPKP